MTLEEARQLKPGDRVLVEATIDICPITKSIFTIEKDITFMTETHDDTLSFSFCAAKAIREKIATPRRKFKAGDIVYASDIAWKVDEDENSYGIVRLSTLNEFAYYSYADIELVCAVENRADRKEEAR